MSVAHSTVHRELISETAEFHSLHFAGNELQLHRVPANRLVVSPRSRRLAQRPVLIDVASQSPIGAVTPATIGTQPAFPPINPDKPNDPEITESQFFPFECFICGRESEYNLPTRLRDGSHHTTLPTPRSRPQGRKDSRVLPALYVVDTRQSSP